MSGDTIAALLGALAAIGALGLGGLGALRTWRMSITKAAERDGKIDYLLGELVTIAKDHEQRLRRGRL